MAEFYIGNIRGLKGDTGTGLTIKDFYSSLDELTTAIPNSNEGDAYGVGEAEPYDIYIYSQRKGWVNSGSLQPDVNDQAPTYAEATTLETLTSGEKIGIAFGKIKKAISVLISHIGNKTNPHNVTASQIGAATDSHSHTANNLMVKSIGGGTDIKENDDLDTYKTIGNYICGLTNTALTLVNCPIRGAFVMTVGYANGTASYLYQEITHFSTGVKYYRSYAAGEKVWSEWRATYNTYNKPTAKDVGAVPALKRINGVDILSLAEEGTYYSTNTQNAPTSVSGGYVRVEYSDVDYKVIRWRPHNSITEYVNVLNGGTWVGWHKIITEPV